MIYKMITCWKLTLTNNKNLFFTDSDINIEYENNKYLAGKHFFPNSIFNSNELGHDNFVISGIIDERFITKDAIMNGDFGSGFVEVFLLDLNKNPINKIVLKTGWISEIKITNNSFTMDVSSIGSKTNNLLGKCFSTSCRAEFGDKFCKMKIEEYTFSGFVTSVNTNNSFIDENRLEPDEYFNKGVLIFTSGKHEAKKINILVYQNKTFYLDYFSKLNIEKNDTYKIIVGCDKALQTCLTRFNNVINFRGEPYIPGKYKLLACK